jgi:hypothetical protein
MQRLGRFALRDLYACLEIVIASAAKQSILSLRGEIDCFAALAMTVLRLLFENGIENQHMRRLSSGWMGNKTDRMDG